LHAGSSEVGTHARHHPAKRETKLRKSFADPDFFCSDLGFFCSEEDQKTRNIISRQICHVTGMHSHQLLDSFGRTIAASDPGYLGGAPKYTLRSWKSESFDTMMKPLARA
jgi:hypothetical protein